MALKTVDFEYQEYIPICERGKEKPTTIVGAPLNKGEYDRYMDSLRTELRGRSFRTKRSEALERIYRNRIKEIRNCILRGEVKDKITDPNEIVYFLTHLESAEVGNEIDNWLLSISSLEEEEEKNSLGQSGSSYLEVKGKTGTAKNVNRKISGIG